MSEENQEQLTGEQEPLLTNVGASDDLNEGTPAVTIPDEKTVNAVNVEDVVEKVSDVEIFGNGDLFQLLSKASSEKQGWMKSTKAMNVTGVGCVVQVTTQQKNTDGTYSIAEAVTFVPGVKVGKAHKAAKDLSLVKL